MFDKFIERIADRVVEKLDARAPKQQSCNTRVYDLKDPADYAQVMSMFAAPGFRS